MIATNTSARSAAPTMPTLTPEFTAWATRARSASATASERATNGSISARMRSTRCAPCPVRNFARACAGERAVSAISGDVQSRMYERHSRSMRGRQYAGRERHEQLRLARELLPGLNVRLQEPPVGREHVSTHAGLEAQNRVLEPRGGDDRRVGALLLPRVVADRPERSGREHELDQEDDGDDSAADQDPGCQAEAHV